MSRSKLSLPLEDVCWHLLNRFSVLWSPVSCRSPLVVNLLDVLFLDEFPNILELLLKVIKAVVTLSLFNRNGIFSELGVSQGRGI